MTEQEMFAAIDARIEEMTNRANAGCKKTRQLIMAHLEGCKTKEEETRAMVELAFLTLMG